MKKVLLFIGIILFAACAKEVVEKPDNLIEENKMVDIIYDLSLLEALKSQKPIYLEKNSINPDYIYKKYKIDSIQFAKSNQYYASDLAKYKSLFEKVNKRLEDAKKLNDSLVKKNSGELPVSDPDAPVVK